MENTRPIQVGMQAELSKLISDADVRTFAEISGDRNPVHLDDDYAAGTVFKRRIAHGALTGALISAVLGQVLPGPGTIYLSQSMKFKAPVYIDDTITAKVEVTAYRPDKRIADFVLQGKGHTALVGKAGAHLPEQAHGGGQRGGIGVAAQIRQGVLVPQGDEG